MVALSERTLKIIDSYRLDPHKPWRYLELDEENLQVDHLNDTMVIIMRELAEGKDPTFNMKIYMQSRMKGVGPESRRIVAWIWELTENPRLQSLRRVNVKEIAHASHIGDHNVSAQLVNLRTKYYVDAEANGRERLYSISDRFLANGLLLTNYPEEWSERFRSGNITRELELAFRINPIRYNNMVYRIKADTLPLPQLTPSTYRLPRESREGMMLRDVMP